MTKKYFTSNTLLIVESPAKCKKIEEFLGPGFKCIATCGHLRELKCLDDIDVDNFQSNYKIMETKKSQISNIKKEIREAGEIIIATDNDREGEAIGWHLCEMFHLNIDTTKRILFHEITEPAIKEAMKSPVRLNKNLIYAQQTRQILDLIVGFEISPLLWKYICNNSKKGLSAGRCQTPALKLIRDREREINLSPGVKVYKTTGCFPINNWNINFELNKDIVEEEEMKEFLQQSISFPHIFNCNNPVKKFSSAPIPFTTSSLQQACSNEMHISPSETMKICQKLYEKGYITYMRTESIHYSVVFIESAHKFITKTWENKYINKENISQSLSKDAHEAIRPTTISLVDLELDDELNSKEKKLYKIIWQNTIESLMVSSSYHSIKARIEAYNNLYFFHTSDLIIFPGWKIVKNNFNTENKEFNFFSSIKEKKSVTYSKITSIVHFQQTKLHYTEAKIVQLLEEKGIGRPSTFASLVDKLQEREYVKKKEIKGKTIECFDYELEQEEETIKEIICKKEFGNEKNKLVIQNLGILVFDFLEKHFGDIFNYEYSKQLEDDLDKIAEGLKTKFDVCKCYYSQITCLKQELINLKIEEGEKKKETVKIDDKHTLLIGKYGPVIKCSEENKKYSFKAIKKDIDMDRIQEYTLDDLLIKKTINMNDKKEKNAISQYNGFPLFIKKGKFGLYASWGKNTKSLKKLGNRPVENIRLEEVMEIISNGNYK
jgi:DNA topoisomerase-1